MLFASTRLTLVRELGLERFEETLVVTEAPELTAEGWKKHEAHTKLAAPLTEEERELGEVKRLESEEGRGSSARKSHVASSGVSMNIADEAKDALAKLNEGGDNLVLVGIDTKSETIVLLSSSSVSAAELPSALPASNPAFSFLRLPSGKVVFIYTCPSSSPVKERMLYASSSRSVHDWAVREGGLEVVRKVEESEPKEIEEKELVEQEDKPKVEMKPKFDRPRRPGRR